MDTTEQRAAAAAFAGAAADLDAGIRSLRLEDPSSLPSKPQHHPAPTNPPCQPQPQSPRAVPMPITRADMLHQLQAVRQHWPQPQPQPQQQQQRYSVQVGESSTGAAYPSPFGASSPSSSFYASHYGAYSPRFTAPLPSPVAAKLSASAQHYDPVAPPHPSAAQPSSSASSSAGHCQPTPGAPTLGSAFAAWDHNAGLNAYPHPGAASASSLLRHDNNGSIGPYAAALQSALAANGLGYQPWFPMAPAARRLPTLEDVRSLLLRGAMEPRHVMSPAIARHVVRLLQEGGEEVRLSVLATVKRAVHSVMGSSEGHAVFLALLRACEVRLGELHGIVQAVRNGTGFLAHVAKYDHGVTCLKRLIMAVAPYPQLCGPLIVWLLGEHLMDHCKGAELLRHCFITVPYQNCSIIIQFAIFNLYEVLKSAPGSRSLAECFDNARDGELHVLEQIVLRYTSAIARGRYSNYFLQRVLERGSEALRAGVVERVAADVVNLAADQYGSYVVEACFLRPGSPGPLHRVLAAFLDLGGDELSEVVRGRYSNYVVHKLLATGKDRSPKQALALARRIERLPAAMLSEMYSQQVMKVVKKLFPRMPRC
ncbi:hypothetical protein ACP70R_013610 [Stipagrostis hirtigluma subsp. patula]